MAGRYLDALDRELDTIGRGLTLDTVYLGGGTPSRLRTEELTRLFDLLRRTVCLDAAREITVECNPETLNDAQVGLLRKLGATRLSLGVQSFQNDLLHTLGRRHDALQGQRAVDAALESGAEVSVDLIFAVPGQTLEQLGTDLDILLRLAPQHVSLYNLTYEPRTPLTRLKEAGGVVPVGEDIETAMLRMIWSRLRQAGYVHYEISNFARPGHASRHNLVYWRGEPYFAAGPGATSYVKGRRARRDPVLPRWLRRIGAGEDAIVEQEVLSPQDRQRERLAFALRLIEGIPIDDFAAGAGATPRQIAGALLRRLAEQGLLECSEQWVRLTPAGVLVADGVMREVLSS
jgi:oxygen-independent coproporphyrinogen-3 oxidase